jgi:cytochrome oxidase Cu insertion factor (SCO1/SenC/PrrC family)
MEIERLLRGCLETLGVRWRVSYTLSRFRRGFEHERDTMMNDLPEARDFTLTDTNGKPVSLSDYRGVKHVVLVFNRGFM